MSITGKKNTGKFYGTSYREETIKQTLLFSYVHNSCLSHYFSPGNIKSGRIRNKPL